MISEFAIGSKCMITAIRETWLTNNDTSISSQLNFRVYINY